MLRYARLGALCVLHHVIARGMRLILTADIKAMAIFFKTVTSLSSAMKTSILKSWFVPSTFPMLNFLAVTLFNRVNPLRAKLVSDMNRLNSYEYCGHGVLMGRRKCDWQDPEYALSFFGRNGSEGMENSGI